MFQWLLDLYLRIASYFKEVACYPKYRNFRIAVLVTGIVSIAIAAIMFFIMMSLFDVVTFTVTMVLLGIFVVSVFLGGVSLFFCLVVYIYNICYKLIDDCSLCPNCGEYVRKSQAKCPKCNHIFFQKTKKAKVDKDNK